MKYSNREEMEREFVKLIKDLNTTGYLMVLALLCSDVKERGMDIVDGYTRGDFKRTIKRLRVAQKYAPHYAEDYEAAIVHIRRKWLHREDPHGDYWGIQNV